MPIRCAWEAEAQARLTSCTDDRFAHSITAFFPAYNDAATIGTLVEYTDRILSQVARDYEIVVVNDGSGDGTAEALADAQQRVPRLRVLSHTTNSGYGGALRAGFAAATKEFIFYTDGDGQYDPTELLSLLGLAEEADLVNGYKIRRGDGLYRAALGHAYRLATRLLFGLRIRDVDCDFRLMRRCLLAQLPLTSASGSICAELVYQLQQAGARIREVPVNHYPRVAGRSQFLRPWRVACSLTWLAKLWWELRVRPWGGRSVTFLTPRARRA